MYERSKPRRGDGAGRDAPHLSYKFQRLREQLRSAILGGEFESRLPGERTLGRRFHANPKTINKALSDLSSEGLVVRHIGRGTFVAGREGEDAEPRRRKVQCLLPVACDGVARRPAVIDAVGEILGKQGHDFEMVRAEAVEASGAIARASWMTATRRVTDGLLCCPMHPLSGGSGHFGEDLVAEVLRRQVPAVVVGACAPSAKLNAVVPDYTDAGFRLTDHLYRLGCGAVVVVYRGGECREAAMVLSGCRTAATRFGGEMSELALPQDGRDGRTGPLDLIASDPASRAVPGPVLPASRLVPSRSSCRGAHTADTCLGVVCVGVDALMAVESDERMASLRASGHIAVVCVSEPGDRLTRDLGLTAFEWETDQMASWAARLLVEARPGDRPVEVVVPGRLEVRGGRGRTVSEEASGRRSDVAIKQ